MKTERKKLIALKTMQLSIACLLVAGFNGSGLTVQEAQGADFKHAKKIIVPPSRIPRRYDYDSMSGTVATPSPSASPSYYATYPSQSSSITTSSGTTRAKPIKKNKNGLVPPPPPVAPSLLPASLARDIPPPPPNVPSYTRAPKPAAATSNRFSPHQTKFHPDRHPYGKNRVHSYASGQVVARAKKLIATGHLKDAQELLAKNHKTYPKNQEIKKLLTEVSIDRSKYYLRKDSYKEAATQARVALAYNSESKDARSMLNQALRHQGIDSLSSSARLAQAQTLFTHGKLEEAKIEYDESIKLSPSDTAYIGLGNVAYSQGSLKTAKAHYQKALGMHPQSSIALRQLGITRYKLSDVVGANADLTRALVLDPNDKLASQTLIDLWQRQVATRPNDANSHLGLARAYQLSGDLNSAQNEYRTVVKIDPNHPNLPAARQSFKLALARQQAVKAYQASQTLYAHDAYREAFDKASLAVRLSPGNTEYKMFQAQILEKLGDLNGAKQQYLTILHDNPHHVAAARRIKALNLLALSPTNSAAPKQVGLLASQGTLAPQTNSLNVPQYRGEGPALPYLPGPNPGGAYKKVPTGDHVQNMTGFLGSLRDLMLKQKKALQANEDEVLKKINPSSTSSASTSSSIAGIDTSVKPLDVGNLISSNDVKKLIAGAPSSSASATSAPAAASATSAATSTASSAASTSASTATSAPQSWSELAISAGRNIAQDSRFSSLANMAATAAPTIMNKNFKPEDAQRFLNTLKSPSSSSTPDTAKSTSTTVPTSTGATQAPPVSLSSQPVKAAPQVVRQAQSIPPLAPPIQRNQSPVLASTASNTEYTTKMNDLELRNKQLLSQLHEAHKQISSLKSQSSPSLSPTNQATGNLTEPTGLTANENVNGIVESPGLVATQPPSSNPIHHHEPPNLRGAIPQPNLKPEIKKVHLELLGVKAKSKNINLKVRLRNEQDNDLTIPSNRKAIIRMVGREDQTAKIKFPKRKLQAHSTMEGYITVPGKRLSPAADVFIPELAGVSNAKENVHLTLPVPISSLNSSSH